MRGFILSRAISIARKETRHILRDPFTLALGLGLPVLMVAFFGAVIDLNVRHIKMIVADGDHSRASRELTALFTANGYFDVTHEIPGPWLQRRLDAEQTKAVLRIEPQFERHVRAGEDVAAQLLLDGSDNSVAGVIVSDVQAIQDIAVRRFYGHEAQPFTLKTRFLFNPELNSRWFVVPGLAVVILGIFSVLLTSLTVAREWENGSMELLLSTPVRPVEIIAGKVAPYLVVNLVGVAFIYAVARWGFGVPFRGSHLLFMLATLLFLATTLSQGLFISVSLRQQQLAMQVALLSGQLPALLLSGFLFPVESMPAFFRGFTMILAPRWYMVVCRGLFLKGAGWHELAWPLLMMLAIGTVMVTLAVRRFKTDLEP